MEDLIKTVSDIERVALPDITGLPAPSMSGRFRAAPIDKVCHASDDQFMSCWIEFRGDVVVLVKSDDSHKGVTPRSLGPKQAAFCCVVKAPPAAICTSPELNALAQRIMNKTMLAIHSPDTNGIWIDFNNDAQEMQRWKQVSLSAESFAPTSSRRPIFNLPFSPLITFRCPFALLARRLTSSSRSATGKPGTLLV